MPFSRPNGQGLHLLSKQMSAAMAVRYSDALTTFSQQGKKLASPSLPLEPSRLLLPLAAGRFA